ncbi:UDP-N-acetylmuramoyl-L-alanyl-D-glutamate--2,6-diaminopimelate ligase [Methylocystis sp. SB2]|uniref:UDP-N-acetylmuramoyl-L-alanyl-D-glutamate--2, 6-diaminopimelate ligase n=1 Tax=Methylocystis sp. (strain SB2) TaxID=743836 RepID=UPI0004150CCF|nr:UDP-N-acetylmuramoyl-L-alanyl-D-glutamate--2,6-diaminopimelate ligase [Methylocystis sp. SB2]ULO23537.1 UDP-N-acetylmuramoyl-L-alanyl-D-glutamate--2,6-diaminopimelate ligase [Methylocystis sp. SB2]
MLISELLATPDLEPALRGLAVSGLTADSRMARSGFAFFAIPGHAGDGMSYVADAKSRGACVVVAQRRADSPLPLVVVDDVRRALALAAARFFSRQPSMIAAVTGTSGKTSVVAFLRQIWAALGHEAASLGTVGIVDSRGAHYGALTTPGPVELHRTLDELAGRGVTHLAMEASSLGIDQRRLDGMRVDVAGFTNFSRDHLDHHADMEEYFAAKMRLFDTLLHPGQTAVIDADSDIASRVIEICRARSLTILSVGSKGETIKLLSATPSALATSLRLRHNGADYEVNLPLAGAFQVSNALVAAGLAIASGDDPGQVFAALEALKGAPGRLELVGQRNGAPIFVDYAHKPDALEKVLATLRPLTKKRLIVVFGCGGDRDRGKRPLMGDIVARAADVAIVTDDNPRSEDAAAIRAEILEGTRSGAAHIIEIGDRRAAIANAVAGLEVGDALVVAGKGHETGQIVGDRVLPFSDHEAIAQALKENHP